LLHFWLVTPISGAALGDRWKLELLGIVIVAVSLVVFVLVFRAIG